MIVSIEIFEAAAAGGSEVPAIDIIININKI